VAILFRLCALWDLASAMPSSLADIETIQVMIDEEHLQARELCPGLMRCFATQVVLLFMRFASLTTYLANCFAAVWIALELVAWLGVTSYPRPHMSHDITHRLGRDVLAEELSSDITEVHFFAFSSAAGCLTVITSVSASGMIAAASGNFSTVLIPATVLL